MISVYLTPDKAQVVDGNLKDGELTVNSVNEFACSALDMFEDIDDVEYYYEDDENQENVLDEFFHDIKSFMDAKHDPINVVLPDYLFAFIDCFKFETQEDLEQQLCEESLRDLDEIYYSVPIITQPAPQEQWGTVYAIDKKIINAFVDAADRQNVKLMSIEAASLSYLRATGKFSKEEFMFQAFSNHATFLAYSSIAGMFKMDVPDLCLNSLSEMEEDEANSIINSYIVQFESTALKTFSYMNQNIPFTDLSDEEVISKFSAFDGRVAENPIFAPYIISYLEDDDHYRVMCSIGSLLQNKIVNSDLYPEDIDSYEQVTSGNLLPLGIQQNTHAFQFFLKLKKILFIFCGILIVGLGAVLGTSFFMANVTIPQSLNDEYNLAKENIEEIKRESDLIILKKKEDCSPIEAMAVILEKRPKELGFASVTIAMENGKKKKNWIKLKAASADPLVFQNYIKDLNSNPALANIGITKIDSNFKAGYKAAEINIGRSENGK